MTVRLYLRVLPMHEGASEEEYDDEILGIKEIVNQTVVPKLKCDPDNVHYENDGEGMLTVTMFRENKRKLKRIHNELKKDLNWIKRYWMRVFSYEII